MLYQINSYWNFFQCSKATLLFKISIPFHVYYCYFTPISLLAVCLPFRAKASRWWFRKCVHVLNKQVGMGYRYVYYLQAAKHVWLNNKKTNLYQTLRNWRLQCVQQLLSDIASAGATRGGAYIHLSYVMAKVLFNIKTR